MDFTITLTGIPVSELNAIVNALRPWCGSTTDGPSDTGQAEGVRQRRRRSAPEDGGTTPSDASGTEGDQEKPQRRRRRSAPEGAGEAEPEAAPRRRRGRPSKSEAEAEAEITDVDLTKAATNAAEVLSPKGVDAVLDEFGVATLGDLKQDQRQEFLEFLDAAVDKAKEEAEAAEEEEAAPRRRRRRS